MTKEFPIKNLNEVCEVIAGQSPKSTYYNIEGLGLPFYQGKKEFGDKYLGPPSTWTTKITKEAKDGDILMSVRAPVGPVNFCTEKICIGRGLAAIRVKEKVDKEYLFYFLLKHESEIESNSGAVFNSINKTQIGNIKVPMPSIEEQQNIVSILDRTFTAIDQAKANIEKNIENAKELFQAKLNEIFSQKEEGWEEQRLKSITTKIGSGATPRGGKAAYKEEGISLIRSMNVHDEGFQVKNLAFIDNEQARNLQNVTIEENDVLINITGASVARCCVVPKEIIPARVNQHVSILRAKEVILPQYLHFSLISSFNKKKLLEIGEQGSTRQAITKRQLEDFKVFFPTELDEQNRLVSAATHFRHSTEDLLEIYNDKLYALEELKKSILEKAFSGELTQREIEV